MNLRPILSILACAALSAGCASRPFATHLDTGLPPGNAGDVALSRSGRFVAAMNGPDGSMSVFAIADREHDRPLGQFPSVTAWSVDFAGDGRPERIAFAPGIGGGDALHALVRDSGTGKASVRRVYVSGRNSLGVDESIAEDPDEARTAELFSDASPVQEDERLRVREEVRRLQASGEMPFAASDVLVDAASWEHRKRRFVFATLADGDAVLCFETTVRGQAALLSILPCGAPRGLAVDAGRGLLFAADVRGARIAVFDLKSGKAGLR